MNVDKFELEQYKALRGEILRAMEDANQIMSFGLASIGIVITAGLSVKDTLLGFFVFSVIIPALSGLVLSIWFAAHERISRASYFISGIEARLRSTNPSFEGPTWDLWLRSPSKTKNGGSHHFWNTEFSGIGIFAFFMIGPLLLSLLVGSGSTTLAVRLSTFIVASVALAVFFYRLRMRVAVWRNGLSKTFGEID
jgi:hypothetical protein